MKEYYFGEQNKTCLRKVSFEVKMCKLTSYDNCTMRVAIEGRKERMKRQLYGIGGKAYIGM